MYVDYDPNRFVVIRQQCDSLDWMKRQLDNNPRLRDVLFIYRAVETNTFFLAEWFIQDSLFVPLMEIGSELSAFNKATAQRFLREIVKPANPRDQVLQLKKAESDHDKETEEFHEKRVASRSKMYRDYTDVRPCGGSVFLPLDIQRG